MGRERMEEAARWLAALRAQMASVSPSHWICVGLVAVSNNFMWRKITNHCSGLRLLREGAAPPPRKRVVSGLTTLTCYDIHSDQNVLKSRVQEHGILHTRSIECILQCNCFSSYFFNCGKHWRIFPQISQDFMCVYSSVNYQLTYFALQIVNFLLNY